MYDRLPEGVRRTYRVLNRAPSFFAWRLAPHGRAHAAGVLEPLRNRFRGCRAVLMGNGPSLRRTDWTLLRDEFTLGTNRIYLLRSEMGFDPTVYVCVNDLVLGQFRHEIQHVRSLKVLDWRHGHRSLAADARTVFLPEVPSMRFHTDLLTGWNFGYTVTFAALQIAFYLGFDRVILVGVDHRFRASGPAMREVVSEGPDPDHFAPDYFGQGVRWHLPNLAGSEHFYRLARRAFEEAGREVLDATEGGALGVFPRTSLREALSRTDAAPASRSTLRAPLSGE